MTTSLLQRVMVSYPVDQRQPDSVSVRSGHRGVEYRGRAVVEYREHARMDRRRPVLSAIFVLMSRVGREAGGSGGSNNDPQSKSPVICQP